MELASPSSIKLVIKTPNQRVKDIEVSCLLDWTVEKLKSHLSTVYPTKPARSSQKIIYSGKLLEDQIVLKDVLQESEGNQQTVHLVCTPSSSELSSSQQTAPVSNASAIPSPQVTSTPSSTTTTQGTTQPDGLRHRAHAFAQHPFYNMQFGHPPHYPHMGQANVHTNMGGHMPPAAPPYMYPNAQYFGAHNIHYAAAQHMAHFHWMQHMAQMMHGNVHNMHGLPVAQPNVPYMQHNVAHNVAQQMPEANQPAAAAVPQVPQAQERRENPAQNRNMVMNANAGGGMMQNNDDEEENGQRDWLDYIYMTVRIFMLMSIFWFYSSPERLIVMGLIVFIVWLVQSGVFNLNRAQRNRQPEQPVVNPANNEPERPEDDQGTTEGVEEMEEDTESESESQAEDQTDNTNTDNNNSHPGYFVLGYNFFVTFFTSLVPQAPGAIAQP